MCGGGRNHPLDIAEREVIVIAAKVFQGGKRTAAVVAALCDR